jgi:hypothetical protein
MVRSVPQACPRTREQPNRGKVATVSSSRLPELTSSAFVCPSDISLTSAAVIGCGDDPGTVQATSASMANGSSARDFYDRARGE